MEMYGDFFVVTVTGGTYCYLVGRDRVECSVPVEKH